MVCSTILTGGVYRGRDEIDRIAGVIKATHPDFNISQSPRPRKWAMAGGSMGIWHAREAASLRRD